MKAEIICIIDESGSMESIRDDAIGGFNTFLDEQKKVPGEATLTLVKFNNKISTVLENEPLADVIPLSQKTYFPRRTTALFDAIGFTIDSVGKRLAATPEDARPDKVIVAILTDGQENSSITFKDRPDLIKEKINHQREKYSWEFIFLAANTDAFADGTVLGILPKDISSFISTSAGIRDAYIKTSTMTTGYRIS